MRPLLLIAMIVAACFVLPGIYGQSAQRESPATSAHRAKHKASPTPAPEPSATVADQTTKDTANVAGSIIAMVIFVVLGAGMYLLPMIVAALRHHHNAGAIAVTNFLLGWTVIGWIASLIWACTSPPPVPRG